MTMELIGSLGCGSMIVEAALALAGLPCALTDVPYLQHGPARARALALNPLGQAPTLVLDDARVMTAFAPSCFTRFSPMATSRRAGRMQAPRACAAGEHGVGARSDVFSMGGGGRAGAVCRRGVGQRI